MKFNVAINHSRCGAAGECIDACKSGVWGWKEIEVKSFSGMRKRSMPAPIYPEKCVGCMECVKICPTKTISVTLIQ